MPELTLTLPERLRELAEHFADAAPVDAVPFREVRAALRGAADELERLAEPSQDVLDARVLDSDPAALSRRMVENSRALGHTAAASLLVQGANAIERLRRRAIELDRAAYPLRSPAEPRETYVSSTMGDFVAPAGHVFAAIVLPQSEALEYLGEAAPRRVMAFYRDGERRPSPGSFAFVGPALAVWRVLSVDVPEPGPGEVVPVHRDRDGTERSAVLLELEPVAAHDVPVSTRSVEQVPLPVHEVQSAEVTA